MVSPCISSLPLSHFSPFFSTHNHQPPFLLHSTHPHLSLFHFPHFQSLKNPNFSPNFPSLHPPSSTSSPITGDHSSEPDDEYLHAIAEILTQAGVSEFEALEIASNAPQYTKMLRDSVNELDELSLWGSWLSKLEDTHVQDMTLKTKAKKIAMEKGDFGKIPCFESIGFTLSSSIRLARLLSSQPLPSLILKVKYVKELFFSGSDDERRAGQLARRMMLHLSIAIDEDVQQTLSFFEKIEARRGGLDMLGYCDTSFRYLIESFPRLLLLPLETHMKPMANFLENLGVPKECIGNVLLLFPPLFFLDIEEKTGDGSWAFPMVGALGKISGRMLVKYPWVISASIQKNYNNILDFLEAEKVPKVSIERAIRDWPLLLGCSADRLKPMMEQFDDLSVRTTNVGKVIATSPQLLLRRPGEFRMVVTFLQDLGFEKESIGKILVRCPEVFATRNEETLQRKLEFLSSLGILKKELPRVIKKYPELFISDIERTVVPRLRYLMKSGLTEKNVASMLVRFSPLLGYSIEEVLKPKLEFLVNTMGMSVKEVVEYPRYFSYSLDKKIKPRFFFLQSKNINCSLKDMLAKNDDEFTTEYLGLDKTLVSSIK